MSEPEIVYCDDYEALTGKTRPVVETKVIGAPDVEQPATADVQVETA